MQRRHECQGAQFTPCHSCGPAWLQGQLSMHTAVLSPEGMTVLMRVNMDTYHAQLDSMLQDKSSNGTEHWQQVAVCRPVSLLAC